MTLEISPALAARLASEQIVWITTVRADGTPLPTPVWFLWDGSTFLIFTQPASVKLRNIAQNPKVALNFNTDAYGGSVAVIFGEAWMETQPVSQAQIDAYLEKYREGIKMIGFTPERMAAVFSTALRVRPTRVRTME